MDERLGGDGARAQREVLPDGRNRNFPLIVTRSQERVGAERIFAGRNQKSYSKPLIFSVK